MLNGVNTPSLSIATPGCFRLLGRAKAKDGLEMSSVGSYFWRPKFCLGMRHCKMINLEDETMGIINITINCYHIYLKMNSHHRY